MKQTTTLSLTLQLSLLNHHTRGWLEPSPAHINSATAAFSSLCISGIPNPSPPRPRPPSHPTNNNIFIHCSVSERKLRSDRLETTCPKALDWIRQRITFHTQPSPSEVKWKHDYGPGNHTRSDTDGSLVCLRPELCSCMPVRYLLGTKAQLYDVIMGEMAEAVSSAIEHMND